MVKRILGILHSAKDLSKAAVRGALQSSGTAALYLCTSTLLAAILTIAYLNYAWEIDKQQWYRAYAILQGIELDEIHQAEQDRAADIYYERVLATRAERLRDEEFQDIRQAVFSQPPPPEEPGPAPPAEPNDAERIGAYDRRLAADRARAQSEGLLEQTQLIENMPPFQAKEVIRNLWQENPQRVLQMLSGMEERSRQRILYAMDESDDEELKDLCEILQRIGDGEPMLSTIERAANEP